MTKLGDNIRAERNRRRLSQAGLAAAVGKTAQQVSMYETGETTPSLDTVVKIADLFDMSVDELLGRDYTSKFFREFFGVNS